MARATKTLRVTQGSDEANDGTNRYPVNTDGTVVVPADVAERLMAGGGFIEIVDDSAPAPAPKGWAKLRNTSGSGCSWDGVAYEPDKTGAVTVPLSAVADLASHGFEPTDDQPKAETPETLAEEPAAEEVETPAETPETLAKA